MELFLVTSVNTMLINDLDGDYKNGVISFSDKVTNKCKLKSGDKYELDLRYS